MIISTLAIKSWQYTAWDMAGLDIFFLVALKLQELPAWEQAVMLWQNMPLKLK